MPFIGFGTWKVKGDKVKEVINAALKAGYKHIDTAAVYECEADVGAALAAAFATGITKREEIFITSKLWNSEHAPEDVLPACERTLRDLQLDYLDLYLIHWPQAFKKQPEAVGTNVSFPRNSDGSLKYDMETSLLETWKAMEELVKCGKVRSIGLSNFNAYQVDCIVAGASIKPAVLQVESHPYFSQEPLRAKCQKHGIVMTAYSPLGSGATVDGNTVPTDSTLTAIAKKYKKTAAQLAIAWQKQRGVVVIPKSLNPARIAANVDVQDIVITEEDMNAINSLNQNVRVGWGGALVESNGKLKPRDEDHVNYPFKDDKSFLDRRFSKA